MTSTQRPFWCDPRRGEGFSYEELEQAIVARCAAERTPPESLPGIADPDGTTLKNWLADLAAHAPHPSQEPPRNFAWESLQHSTIAVEITTSGSSGGRRQAFRHTWAELAQGVRTSTEHRTAIWGLAYPLDHLAGLQVLCQALANLNPLVNLQHLSHDQLVEVLADRSITHLSCTPTFLRLLLAHPGTFPAVRRLTLGGERADRDLFSAARRMFPNARFTNIYATTETGTVLVSDHDCFVVPADLRGLVQVREESLWLHRSLRRRSHPGAEPRGELDETRLTGAAAELRETGQGGTDGRSFGGPADADPFWSTGDLVQVVADEPLTIRFVGRHHEWFNVAGQRVDPGRLEQLARGYPGIADIHFYPVPNSVTENLVACQILLQPAAGANWDPVPFRQWWSQQVSRAEQPRWIQIVTELPRTQSGKRCRLPSP